MMGFCDQLTVFAHGSPAGGIISILQGLSQFGNRCTSGLIERSGKGIVSRLLAGYYVSNRTELAGLLAPPPRAILRPAIKGIFRNRLGYCKSEPDADTLSSPCSFFSDVLREEIYP